MSRRKRCLRLTPPVADARTHGEHFEVRTRRERLARQLGPPEDRDGAIARGRRALAELEIAGVPTTRELALDILGSEPFVTGNYSTNYVEDAESLLPSLAAG